MKQLTFLVKPASSLCDLRCRYCFYEDIAQCRQQASMGIMKPETTRALLQAAAAECQAGDVIQITFQGGEPTLAGLDFFRDFVRLEEEIMPDGVRVNHSIQTNGMTLTKEWSEFLRQHRVLVGLSLDGYEELHDENRRFPDGSGSFSRVLEAAKLRLESINRIGAVDAHQP